MTSFYKEIIIDHYQNPRNFGKLKKPDAVFETENTFCGDRIRIEVQVTNNKQQKIIKNIKFSGEGCAVSIASASMLTEKAKSKKIKDLKNLTKDDIVKILGINLTPVRLKCALLPLEALQKAIVIYE